MVGIFGSNAVQWIFFSKSLQLCSSSVVATVTSTAANFVLTVSSLYDYSFIKSENAIVCADYEFFICL